MGGFSIAEMKARSRDMLHKSMSVAALHFTHPVAPGVAGTPITVRWHNKIVREGGQFDGTEIITGVDRLIFIEDELTVEGISLSRNDEVLIPEYNNMRFSLDTEDVNDGPVTTSWSVVLLSDDR
jgi:hypothetical protein